MPKGYTFDSSHGPGVTGSSAGSSSSGSGSSGSSSSAFNALRNLVSNTNSGGSGFNQARDVVSNMASNISEIASTNTSLLGDKIREILSNPSTSASQASVYNMMDTTYDMDEMYDMLMDLAGYNNDWAANQAQLNRDFQSTEAKRAMDFEYSQAKKQMDFQWASDRRAMAWSAQEAAKEREWSKNLSDTAHRREVKDLLAAGLNPILAANNGAWSGSGAAGSGYTSSGAMGAGHAGSGSMAQTDFGVTGVFGSLLSNSMSTARDMAVTKLQTDQQRYNTDIQYAIAKMQAETAIYNNNSNIDANKAIRALDRDADIRKAGIAANATQSAAAMNAGAITSAAATNAAAARYSADANKEYNMYRTDTENALERYKWDNPSGNVQHESQHNMTKDPITYFGDTTANWFVDKAIELGDLLNDLNNKGSKNGYKDYGSGRGF